MLSRFSTPKGRRLVPMILAMVLAMTAGTAIGGHFVTAVKSFTGCLNAGTIVQVAEGDAPAKRCANNQVEVHFSGGDITAITAGTGLVGGGENGAAALAIAPAYQLPQACATTQVAKWNGTGWACGADNSAAYTAGTGLDLNGTEFSLDGDYQLPQGCQRGEAVARVPGLSAGLDQWGCRQYAQASDSCPSGQFARATGSDGGLVCAVPAAGTAGTALSGRQTSFESGMGLPDDDVYREVASVNTPAGTYLVTAKGQIRSEMNVEDFSSPTSCRLFGAGAEFDYYQFVNADLDDNAFVHAFSLTGVVTLSAPGPISLQCQAGTGANGISVRYGQVAAIKAG